MLDWDTTSKATTRTTPTPAPKKEAVVPSADKPADDKPKEEKLMKKEEPIAIDPAGDPFVMDVDKGGYAPDDDDEYGDEMEGYGSETEDVDEDYDYGDEDYDSESEEPDSAPTKQAPARKITGLGSYHEWRM